MLFFNQLQVHFAEGFEKFGFGRKDYFHYFPPKESAILALNTASVSRDCFVSLRAAGTRISSIITSLRGTVEFQLPRPQGSDRSVEIASLRESRKYAKAHWEKNYFSKHELISLTIFENEP